MPFWLLMIALPHWRWTKRIAGSLWIVAPAALLYALLVLPQLATALPLLMNPTLDGIAGLLGTPAGATIAGPLPGIRPLRCGSLGSIWTAVSASPPGWCRRPSCSWCSHVRTAGLPALHGRVCKRRIAADLPSGT
ncbi:MAG: abscisic acid-deficient protein Aba4 family protein [Caldilineaceae bacterium]